MHAKFCFSIVDAGVFAVTRRGRKCLIYDDYIFYANLSKGTRMFWVCSDYYKVKCRARCVSDVYGRIAKVNALHNHPPHSDRIDKSMY